ncbi:MAG: RagB/SusD family nutrient uptake outer membrane protein [Prevotella sp.]
MKKIMLLALTVMLTACHDFLDEVDQDKLIPSKTEHYAAVLLNNNQYNFPIFVNANFMTDDITEYSQSLESSRKAKKPVYTWQIEIEKDEDGNKATTDNTWTNAYKNISICNYVHELVEDAEGTKEEKAFIKGEAKFFRAYNYFNLLNLYGVPFDSENAAHALGVPLRLDNGIEQTFQRNTVAECYQQIEADLREAIELITESSIEKSIHHPSAASCHLLLSRIYLYQEKWQEAAEAATKAMEGHQLTRMTTSGTWVSEDNPEVLYTGMFYNGTITHSVFETGWKVSPELIAMYSADDIRLSRFFTKVAGKLGNVYYCNKGERDYSQIGYVAFRVAEAYLTRAEAYARQGKTQEAKTDLTTLLATRYKSGASYVIPDDSAALLEYILNERRKELCFEEHHRWFDLRRMKTDAPEIKHSYTLTDTDGTQYGTQVYTLFPADLNYTLPIPLAERENNPLIQNNERYDKLPETTGEF